MSQGNKRSMLWKLSLLKMLKEIKTLLDISATKYKLKIILIIGWIPYRRFCEKRPQELLTRKYLSEHHKSSKW